MGVFLQFTTTMTSPRYESARKVIYDSIAATEAALTNYKRMFDSVAAALAHAEKAIAAWPLDLPNKRKKGLLTKLRGPREIENVAPIFSERWPIIAKAIAPLAGQTIVQFNIGEVIGPHIQKLLDEYTERMRQLKSRVDNEVASLQQATDARTKALQSYKSICSQLEDLNTKLQPQNTAGKPPDVVKKLQDQFLELKKAYLPAYESADEKTRELNAARLRYGLAIEEMISLFQDGDLVVSDRLSELNQKVFDMFDQYKTAKEMTMQNMEKILKNRDFQADVDTMRANEGIDNVTTQGLVKVRTVPIPIPINFSQFFGPDKVFGSDMKTYDASVTSAYTAKKSGEIDVNAGQMVTVLKLKGKKATIINHETHKMGEVPSAVIRKTSGQGRKLVRVKEDYEAPDTGLKLMQGELVMATEAGANMAHVQSASYHIRNVPLSVLDF